MFTKKYKIFTLIVLCFSQFLNAQVNSCPQFEWTKKIGGSGNHYVKDMVIDKMGNSYIVGIFEKKDTFGNIVLTSAGYYDCFVAKIDSSGNWIWAYSAGGSGSDDIQSISIDTNGYIYFLGSYDYHANFGKTTLNSSTSSMFLAKMNFSGNWIWAKNIDGHPVLQLYNFTVDNQGSLYIQGVYLENAKIGNTNMYGLRNSVNLYFAKLNSAGNWLWVINTAGKTEKIISDNIGNIYLTGTYRGKINFGNFSFTAIGNYDDIYIAKIDSKGNWLWAKTSSGNGNDKVKSMVLDSECNIYTTGTFSDTISIGKTLLIPKGGDDIFITKMDSSGNWLWAIGEGANEQEQSFDIVLDNKSNIYITGNYDNTSKIGNTILEGLHATNLFVAKFDSTGKSIWALSGKGSCYPSNIVLDKNKNMYITGNYYGNVSFGLDTLKSNKLDLFASKIAEQILYNEDIIDQTITCSQSIEIPASGKYYYDINWSPTIGLNNPKILNPISSAIQTTPYTLTLTNGCGESISKNITVYVNPYKIKLNEDTTITCGNEKYLNTELSDTIQHINYNWVPNYFLSKTDTTFSIANPIKSTKYIVSATTKEGCFAQDSIMINVNPISVNKQKDTAIICGNYVGLFVDIVDSIPNVIFEWFPNYYLNSEKSNNPIARPPLSQSYQISVSTPNGCLTKDSIFISVNPYTIHAGNDVAFDCGKSVQLNAVVSDSVADIQYKWSPSDGINIPTIKYPIASPIIATEYHVIATTTNGCKASDSLLVAINNTPPNVNIQSNTGNFLLCDAGLELSVSGFETYKWSTSEQSSSITVKKAGWYSVEVVNSSGCYGIDSVEIINTDVEITTPDGELLCPELSNQKLTLTASSGMEKYKWSTGEETRSIEVNTPENYYVIATKNECDFTVNKEIKLSNGIATADFKQNINKYLVYFINTSPSIDSSFWDFGDGETSTENNPNHNYKTAGNFDVKLSLTDVCGDYTEITKTIYVSGLANVQNKMLDKKIIVYPNPTQNILNHCCPLKV